MTKPTVNIEELRALAQSRADAPEKPLSDSEFQQWLYSTRPQVVLALLDVVSAAERWRDNRGPKQRGSLTEDLEAAIDRMRGAVR